jgi:hypothetical protein
MNGNGNDQPRHISECLPKEFDFSSIRKKLEEPFDASCIKYRPGNFGQTLAYIEGHEIIKRLNEVFNSRWSFEIVEHQVNQAEVQVLGKITCCNGTVTKMAFGGSKVTVNTDTGVEVNIVDDLKAAATDALKKAASLLGVGLHLYEKDGTLKENGNGNGKGNGGAAPSSQSDQGNGNGNGGTGDSRLTAKQLAYIQKLARDRGLDKDDIQRMSVQQFDRVPEFLSKSSASQLIQHLQSA